MQRGQVGPVSQLCRGRYTHVRMCIKVNEQQLFRWTTDFFPKARMEKRNNVTMVFDNATMKVARW